MSNKQKIEFKFSICISMKELKEQVDRTLTDTECDEIFSRVSESSIEYEAWYWVKDAYEEVIAERNLSDEEV